MRGAVHLPAAAADAILAQATAEAPLEACGLLVGRDRDVVRVAPTANLDAATTRYTIPPEAHFAVLRAARHEGLQIVGAYHSHPHGPAVPSATDAAEAFGGFVFLIAGLVPSPHLRAWQLVAGNFVELRLVRT